MNLPNDIVSQFAKVINSANRKPKTDKIVYGTAVVDGDSIKVRIDGSDLDTPVTTTADIQNGERVTVMIKNHEAIITGNISSPAARTDDVQYIGDVSKLIEMLQESVNGVESAIGSLAGDIDNLQRADSAINDILTDHATILAGITTQLTNLTSDIATIKTHLGIDDGNSQP